MASKAYYAEIPERPTEVLELQPFNDGTNRGCKIVDVSDEIAGEGWAQVIQCPSKIISIAGERITSYTFKNIRRMLTKCPLPIRFRLEAMSFAPPTLKTNGSSDSESDASDAGYNQFKTNSKSKRNKYSPAYSKRKSYNSRYNKQPLKYPLTMNNPPKLKPTASDDSVVSINLGPSIKHCQQCSKTLKENKQHRCRRCAAVVCTKCSKNKRKEVGYDKLVRVCDECVKRDEFIAQVKSKPLGIQIGPLYGKTDDIGGILIIGVKENGGIRELEINENLKFEKTVIIAIGSETDKKLQNIELLGYNDAIEILRNQHIPFEIRCKKWNRNTKSSAKEQLEKEHKEYIQNKLADLQREEEEKKRKEEKKIKKKKGKKSKRNLFDEDEKFEHDRGNSLNHPSSNHHRNGTDSSLGSFAENESPTPKAMAIDPNAIFSSPVNTDRYTGSHEMEDHPAYDLILQAEDAEKNDDLEAALAHYENAMKQFNNTIHDIDNNKVKRKWREKVNDYEIQKLRIQRKVRVRKKMHLRPGGRSTRRSATMQPMKRSKSRKNVSTDYTSDVKNPDQKDNDEGDNGDGADNKDGAKKKDKKKDQDGAFRARLEADIITEKPNVSFKDVQGLANVKLAIYETVILPQKRPELFTGLRAPAMGLLLFGPPGNGKTMIAKCVATEIDSTFFSISASSITSKYVGDAERIMRTLFGLAREKAPSIIFIDEIDSLLTARGGKNEAESSRRIKTEFLVQFDGVHSAKDLKASILVIGATNLPDQLDEAVLRRFSKRILVPHPEYDTRYGLIRTLMRDEPHTLNENDFVKIAKATERYSCSDLAHLCKDAALGPLREMGAVLMDGDFDDNNLPKTGAKHFENSLKNVRSSLSKESLVFYKSWDKKFGSKFHLSVSELPEFLRPKPIEPLD